jgi:hypothetical protein
VVNATKLAELHDKITVADLEVSSGVTILTDPEHPIASVVETKAQISEEEAAEEEVVEGEEITEGEGGEAGETTEGKEEKPTSEEAKE